MEIETTEIDLTPISEFKYCQEPNHSFNFLLLNEQNQAVHSPFQCKDYLQDIFWSEVTGNDSEIWGIEWSQGMFNINRPMFRMALLGGQENMEDRIPYLWEALNLFETALGFTPSKIYRTSNPKHIVVEFSKEWTRNGPLLSSLTSLIRISADYKGGDFLEYLHTVLKELPSNLTPYMRVEKQRLGITLPRFSALLQGMTPECSWEDFDDIQDVHDTGIVEFSGFPEVKS